MVSSPLDIAAFSLSCTSGAQPSDGVPPPHYHQRHHYCPCRANSPPPLLPSTTATGCSSHTSLSFAKSRPAQTCRDVCLEKEEKKKLRQTMKNCEWKRKKITNRGKKAEKQKKKQYIHGQNKRMKFLLIDSSYSLAPSSLLLLRPLPPSPTAAADVVVTAPTSMSRFLS